jgi:hypothetical protein
MSRISNLSNLRIPHFNSWKTIWYEKDKNYSYLFFRDFQLFQYLKGLFYRLKMLTDDFYFDNLTNNCFYIKVNVYLYKFQIKKYFLSFFTDQYLLYNFFLKKRKFNEVLNSSFSNVFYIGSIFYLNTTNSFFSFFSFYLNSFFFSDLNSLSRFTSFFSLSKLNRSINILKKKYNGHPIKFKLRKNLSMFNSFFIARRKNTNLLKHYSFIYILKNILYFLFNLKNNYFFLRSFLHYVEKLKLLKTSSLYFFNIKTQKKDLVSIYYLKENYRRELGRDVFDERTYYDFFFYFFLYSFTLNVEKTIYLFTGNRCIFYPVYYYYRKFPSFLSAKLINDYVLLELEKGNNMYRIFKSLQMYQLKEKYKLKQELMVDFNKELFYSFFNKYKLELKEKFSFFKKLKKRPIKLNRLFAKINKKSFFSKFIEITKLFEELYYNEVLMKKYPLIGIRIECNGPPKRGRQARLVAYHQIVKNYKLFGKMPNKSVLADIDYYQSFARTKQGSIGIKVWIFFYSKTYDSKYKLISVI